MTPDTISVIAQETVLVAVKLLAPILLSSLAIGLLVSMFQAATSIQEQTLTFIPQTGHYHYRPDAGRPRHVTDADRLFPNTGA